MWWGLLLGIGSRGGACIFIRTWIHDLDCLGMGREVAGCLFDAMVGDEIQGDFIVDELFCGSSKRDE